MKQRNQAFFNQNDNQIEIKAGTRLNFNKDSTNSVSNASLNINIFEKKLKQSRLDGLLHLNNCNLSSLIWPIFSPTLAYSFDPDEKFWEVQNLRTIDLSNNNIRKLIPYNYEEILEKKLENYPSIIINGNKIENNEKIFSLPPYSYEGWSELLCLKLRSNKLENYLPLSFFQDCIMLKILDLSNNELTSLINPNEKNNNNNLPLTSLNELKEFYLSNNNITILPSNLLSLIKNIKVLELNNNKIRTLNNNLTWNLPLLTRLNLSNNCLIELPNPFPYLPLLEELNLAGNNLTSLPSLSNLPKLITLDASRNSLTEFPILFNEDNDGNNNSIPLKNLILSYNSINNINKKNFLKLTNITELLLHNNKLITIPLEIEFLKNLKIFDVSNNDLSDLPSTLGYINSLNIIKTEGNCIKSIRQSILNKSVNELKSYLRSRGPSLIQVETYINFVDQNNSNEFTSSRIDSSYATEALSKHKLQELNNMIQNRIRMISTSSNAAVASISSSTTLSSSSTASSDNIVYSLDLSNLSLTTLDNTVFHEEIMRHPKNDTISSVNLSNNSLSNIPIELNILKQSLRYINMSHNKLNLLNSPFIFQFLHTLDLSNNNLTMENCNKILSICIKNLINLSLNNNPLVNYPSILNDGYDLKILNLKNCSLNSINELNFYNLRKLIHLDISNNNIKSIDYLNHRINNQEYGGINNAIHLEFLSLENNSIDYISPILSQLPKLKTLLIAGNLQKMIRPLIVQQGSNKVLEVLKDKYSADRDGEIIFNDNSTNNKVKVSQEKLGDFMNNNINSNNNRILNSNSEYSHSSQPNQYSSQSNQYSYQPNQYSYQSNQYNNGSYANQYPSQYDYNSTQSNQYNNNAYSNQSNHYPTQYNSNYSYQPTRQSNNDYDTSYPRTSSSQGQRQTSSSSSSYHNTNYTNDSRSNQYQYTTSRGGYSNNPPSNTYSSNLNSNLSSRNFDDRSYQSRNYSTQSSELNRTPSSSSSISNLRDNYQYERPQTNPSNNRQEIAKNSRRPHPSDSSISFY